MAHKVGDTVTVKRGPHKGDAHKVIHVHKDGRVNVKPHNKMPHQIKYRHGAATASANDVTKMKEETMLSFEAHSWSHDSGWRKPQAQRKDKFGNVVKDKNVAKNLARKAMKKTADEKKPVSEIARSMTPMRDKFGKSKAEKEADREKLQKIQKMMNRDKAVAKKSTHPGPSEDMDEACWDSHKQVGYKMKGGRRVPNCVPKNENQNAALQKKLSKSAQSSEKGKKAVTLKKAPFRIPSEKDMKNEVLDSDKSRKSYMDKARYSKDRANNSAAANMVRKTSAYKDLKTVQKRDKGMAAARRKAIMKFREM